MKLNAFHNEKLAGVLEKELSRIGKILPVLIQVNTSNEKSKFGCSKSEVEFLIEYCQNLPHLEIRGLMTMAPFVDNEDIIRDCFRSLREIKEELNKKYPYLLELSMGMSHDYQIALEEGSTMIRVGSAIFGERPDYKG